MVCCLSVWVSCCGASWSIIMSGAALYVLFESASGYALFSVEGIDDFQRANEEANKYIEYVLTTPSTSDPTRKAACMPIIASGVPRRHVGLWAWERITYADGWHGRGPARGLSPRRCAALSPTLSTPQSGAISVPGKERNEEGVRDREIGDVRRAPLLWRPLSRPVCLPCAPPVR